MIENDIDNRPFTEQVLSCLPPLPWSVSSEDLNCAYREDLRHMRVFSVDPPGEIVTVEFFSNCSKKNS
jgi:exosome complex exonuclease DIS3/RRP44